MMHSLVSPAPIFGFSFLFAIHAIAMTAVSLGILFFVFYAYKTFTVQQLKTWSLWLVIGGIIGCVLTFGGIQAFRGDVSLRYSSDTMQKNHLMMMEKMMGSSQSTTRDDGMMDMSMHGMTTMLQGKTGDAFDEAFLRMMIPHHQGAIDMAKLAEQSAKHDEIKSMARDILSAQQREIDQMNQWLIDWNYSK